MAGGSTLHTVVISAGRARLPALPDTRFWRFPVSPSTLHDFVLDLLSDPTALAAFQSDAEGALANAGLSDISAVDVQEVIPLVLDYVPTEGLPVLDGVWFNGLPTDVLDGGPAGAISQLQAVAQQLTLGGVPSTSDVNLAAAGAITADSDSLEVFGGVSSWGVADAFLAPHVAVEGDFSAVGDVTNTLDGTLATATGEAGGLVDTATGTVGGATDTLGGLTGSLPGTEGLTSTVFGQVDTLTGVVDGVTGGLTEGINVGHTLDVASLGQSGSSDLALAGSAPVGEVLDTATGLVDGAGLGNVVGNVTDAAHLPVVDTLDVGNLLF